MWPYWFMFLIPAAAAITERRPTPNTAGGIGKRLGASWASVMVLVTIFVGLRYEVGGDWGNYLKNLEEAGTRNFIETITWSDPGYRLIEWIAVQLDLGIVGVNLIASAVFSFGLASFCRSLPRPWLALTVAIPYLVIIVAMGYTRQAIAIGCAMVGLVALGRQRLTLFLVWTLIAATFHKSAVLLLPIAALAATQRRIYVVFWVGLSTLVAYAAVLEDSVDTLRQGYLEAEYASEGALIRLLMNLVPALLLIKYRRRFSMTATQLNLWLWISGISLALLAVFFVSPSSTAVDRVALYMLPLQLLVFSYLPEVLRSPNGKNVNFVGAIVLYYAAVLLVWLNFAVNAEYWIPYRFYPVEALF